MQIEITGHHLDITDALRLHIGKRLEKINARRSPPLQYMHAVLSVSKKRHSCGLLARLDSEEFSAQCDASDMYAAIDGAAEKMERQLQSAKGRRAARRNH
ncbi:MAG: ribosome hibernation-promoting factor, HPF/YfiA family [Gammaproteobacteria bacterium]